jgi:hypothetical protein
MIDKAGPIRLPETGRSVQNCWRNSDPHRNSETRMRIPLCWIAVAWPVLATSSALSADLQPVRLANPVGGHIHPSVCLTPGGTLVVTYGHVNHRDLRLTRSTDAGRTWSPPVAFPPTVGKTYYPGSLTTLQSGQIVHAWNRWSADNNEQEPRSVIYSLSDDEGLTWSEPKPFPRDPAVRSVIRHPITELSRDRWLMSLDDRTFVFDPLNATAQPFGDGRQHGLVPIVRTPRGTFVSGAGLRSLDQGGTWQQIEGFPNLKEQGWRHELVCLSNGYCWLQT